MRKLILFAAFILFTTTVGGFNNSFTEVESFDEEIVGVETIENSKIVVTDTKVHYISDEDRWTEAPSGKISGTIDTSEDFFSIGTRAGGSTLKAYSTGGEELFSERLDTWIGTTSLFELEEDTLILGSSRIFIDAFKVEDGTQVLDYFRHNARKSPHQEARDYTGDGKKEFLVDGGGDRRDKAHLQMVGLDGELRWEIKHQVDHLSESVRAETIDGKALVYSPEKVSLVFLENGSEIWSYENEGESLEVVSGEDQFFVSNSTHFYSIDLKGVKGFVNNIGRNYIDLNYLDEYGQIGALHQNGVQFYGKNGEKLNKLEKKGLTGGAGIVDSDEEILLSTENTLYSARAPEADLDISNPVFLGDSEEMFEAVSLKDPAVISGSYQKDLLPENRTPVSVQTDGPNSIRSVSRAHERERIYVDSREKAMYGSALAAEKNATVTLEKSGVDADWSHKTVEELQEEFIENLEPNHIAVADPNSSSGLLAAYQAVRSGVYPVAFDYSDLENPDSAREWNRETDAERLNSKIAETFEKIGHNRNTIFDGRYISLIDAPRYAHDDPTSGGLIEDEADGDVIYSDLEYGDLNGNGRMDASVGRYPDDPALASKLYHSSFREEGETAVVGSEYIHDRWPVVLANFGGGMFTGNVAERVLEQQGFEVKHFVEHRAEPVQFLLDLAGAPEFILDMRERGDKVEAVLSEQAGDAVKNLSLIIQGLEFAEQALRIFLEYRWQDYIASGIEYPEEPSVEEFERFIDSVLPDRRPLMEAEGFRSSVSGADSILYAGGGTSEWDLPEGTLEPEEVPELNRSIVFDTSSLSGTRDAAMVESFVASGAAAYIGFSSISYHSYASNTAIEYFAYGDKTGESLKKAVNDLRAKSLIYSPNTVVRGGTRDKMEISPVLYGNPEAAKDPFDSQGMEYFQRCRKGICTLTATVEPEPEFRSGTVVLPGADSIRRAFQPVTPVFSLIGELPKGSDVKNISVEEEFYKVDNATLPVHNPVTMEGELENSTIEPEFPDQSYRVETDEVLEYVQAGAVQGDELKVLDESSFRVVYESPLTANLVEENRSVYVQVYSNESRELEIYSAFGERKSVKKVTVNDRERVKLEELGEGETEVEVDVVSGDLRDSASRTFRVPQEPERELHTSELNAGEISEVLLSISNPNEFGVEERTKINLNGNLLLSPEESRKKPVSLKPNSSKTLSWDVIGFKPGEGTVSVGNTSETVKIDKNRFETKKTTDSISSIFTESVNVEISHSADKSSAKLSTKENSISVRKNSSDKTYQWKNPVFTSSLSKTPESEVFTVKTDKGFARMENGEVLERAGLEKKFVEEKSRLLTERARRVEEIMMH